MWCRRALHSFPYRQHHRGIPWKGHCLCGAKWLDGYVPAVCLLWHSLCCRIYSNLIWWLCHSFEFLLSVIITILISDAANKTLGDKLDFNKCAPPVHSKSRYLIAWQLPKSLHNFGNCYTFRLDCQFKIIALVLVKST